jgi:hypothetical protein
MGVPQKKLKAELPCDPEIQLLGFYPKECKSGYNKDTWIPMCIAALFITLRCPTLMNGLRKCGIARCQWLTPVILATWEAIAGGLRFEASPGK